MKRTISAILTLLLLFSMTACNQTATVSPPATSTLPAADGVPAEDVHSTDNSSSAPISVDEMLQEVYRFAEEENLQLIAGAEDAVREQYAQGDTDSRSVFDFLRSNGYCEAKPVEGIYVLNVRLEQSSGLFDALFTVNIDVINPETGAVQNFRTFSSAVTRSCTDGIYLGASRSMRMSFDEEFTRMAAIHNISVDGIHAAVSHVGWIDESGNFTDVSQMVAPESNDFSAVTNHRHPFFGQDGYFYFQDMTNQKSNSGPVKRVPINNLTPNAVEIFREDWSDLHGNDSLIVNGFTYGSTCEYYDESMAYPSYNADDWISPNECVGVDHDRIYKFILSGKKDYWEWTSEQIPLVPDIVGRISRNPIVSSDVSQVAFLSRLTTGADTNTYLFTVPVDGGEPRKVPTDYKFSLNHENWIDVGFRTYLFKWNNGSPQIGEGAVNPAQAIDDNSISGLQVQPEVIFEEDQRETYTVTAEPSLNLRSGPDTSYDKLGTIPTGRKITKIGETAATSGWIVVEYRNENNEVLYGWVSAEYIK